jgi:phage anti-repressor protein
MIDIFYTQNNTPFVWASDLHQLLEIATPLSTWFPRMIEYGFIEDQDFNQTNKKVRLVQGGSTIKKDWAVTIDMAKHIAIVQRTPVGKLIRDYLLNLDKKVHDGRLLDNNQIRALFEICKVMGFFSVQKFFENEHFIIKDRPRDWWNVRAKLLGYGSSDLKEIMDGLGKKYKSIKQALMATDKYELIRMAIMDMFLAMGKSERYAKNVANFAKTIAKEIKPEMYDDTNTSIDFKTEEQRVIIADIKGYKNNSKLLLKF